MRHSAGGKPYRHPTERACRTQGVVLERRAERPGTLSDPLWRPNERPLRATSPQSGAAVAHSAGEPPNNAGDRAPRLPIGLLPPAPSANPPRRSGYSLAGRPRSAGTHRAPTTAHGSASVVLEAECSWPPCCRATIADRRVDIAASRRNSSLLVGLGPLQPAPVLPDPICGQRAGADWRSTK